MPLYKKTILRVGTYHSPDGTVEVTPARLRHWADMHARLKRNKQVVPIDWDHADDVQKAVPMSASSFLKKHRSAKNTVGHLRDLKVAKDGKSAEIVLNIHRKSAAKAADDNSVFVSPVIFERWKDGDGNEYSDVITHVDFVNHPVDAHQSAFQACALRFGLDSGKPKVYRFEVDEAVGDDADDDDASKDAEDDEDVIAMSEEDLVGEDAESEDDKLAKQIKEDLEAAGIAAPADVDPIKQPKEFLGQLCAALRQKAMDNGDQVQDDEIVADATDDVTSTANGDLIETQPEFAAMSLRLKQAEQRSSAAEAKLLSMARQSKLDDLSGLLKSGRITADEFNQRSADLKAVKLSLGEDGEPKRIDLDAFIEARKAIPQGTMWPADSELRMGLVVEEPKDDGAPVSREQAKKFVDEQAKRMGGMIA